MATIPTASQLAIANLYTSLLDRAPDADGFNFWVQNLENGFSLQSITESFLKTPESKAIFPTSQTAEAFISAFYETVFGREPDAGGLAYWVGILNEAGGSASDAARALVVSQIDAIVSTPLSVKPDNLSDAEYAQTVSDRATFTNKLAVGVYFAVDVKGNNLDLAKQALAGVNANPESVEAGRDIADGTTGGTPTVPPVTPEVPPSPPVNTVVGTANNDVFDYTHQTLRTIASINGGAGQDTLNYVDSSTTAASFPAVQVTNVETVNIRNINTVPASAESVYYYSIPTLAAGTTLSVAGLTVTATGGDALATNIAQAVATGITTGNAVVSGSLSGWTAKASTSFLSTSLTFTATTLGNVQDLAITGTGAGTPFTFKIDGRSGIADIIDAGQFTGATALNSDRSTQAVTFNNVLASQSLGIVGDQSMSTGNLTGNYVNGATTATLNLANGVKSDTVAINGKALAEVTVASTGAANTLYALSLASTVHTLTVNAATDLDVGGSTFGGFASGGIAATGLTSVTVSGAANTVDLGRLNSTTLVSIDAGGLAGGVKVTIGEAPQVAFHGGGGNDTVTIAADALITGVINAGEGGNADTIAFITGASLTADTGKHFSGFDVLQVSAARETTETYDSTLIGGISAYRVAESAGSVVLTGLPNEAAVTVTGTVSGSSGLTLSLLDNTGSNDVVNVTLDARLGNLDILSGGRAETELKAVGVETINLHSKGVSLNEFSGNFVHNGDENTDLQQVNIDGDQTILFDVGSTGTGSFLQIDAHTATGAVTVDGDMVAKWLNVTGGEASDTIVGGTTGGVITGGKGGDAITLGSQGTDTWVVYTEADDSRQDFDHAAGTVGAMQDTITGFVTGAGKIGFVPGLYDQSGEFVTYSYDNVAQLLAAQSASNFYLVISSDPNDLDVSAVAARVGNDTYLLVRQGDHSAFDSALDISIKLVGVTDLSVDDLATSFNGVG